ncbi:hemagglutinin repeat-containing protein [Acidovorax sp. NCPPB 3576]|uniref:hemagglutinin repeat-containing protein n=1 Tax=Acidovorax sp. NCPPB 3576 TaxID=2940488 RepID=UPI00234908AA|nr:hemagglutinin repeat-containing protein [Acidovorax sp. NCPPB 3576]WCM88099.1 hemagglutinin repeat-containing protein [Acidovorax sp. NCPPB 3576]
MSKRICLALGFALLTVMASPSRGHEPKSPPAQLDVGHIATKVVATVSVAGTATDHHNESQRAAASSVQSQGGNVAMVAGNRYEQEGSAVLAKGDVSIVGKTVDIHESRELERDLFETRAKQSGLTLTISNPVVSAVQGAQTVTRIAGAMGKTSDTRMQALGLAAAGMAASETYGQVSELLKDPGKAGSVGFNISVGSSQSRSTNAYQVDSAAGSQIKADGNVRITATQGDLRVRGSDIEAGKDVGLVAEKGNVVLEASQNRFAEQNSNSSSSASVGIGINVGAQSGVSFNAGVSQSRGQGSGESVSYTNTHIRANGTASVQSAGDTTLRGATIVADAVRADVGGNLTIESLQDVSRYNEANRSGGLNVSVCLPPLCYSASSVGGSVGRTRIDSDYQSVVEQSGIRAGNGGFDVNVKGNTDLKGGAITSTQAAIDGGKNTFTTGGTLTQSDIENHAAYSASGYNVSGSVGFQMGDQGSAQTPEDRNAAANDKGKPGGSAGVGSDKGSAGSTTRSGISGVSGNTEARTGDAETGIKPIFDKGRVRDEVNAQITITAEFGARASKAVGDYADRKLQEAMNSGDQAEIDNWKEGGAGRVAMHALVGAAGGGLAGAVGAGMSQVAVAQLDSTLRELGVDDGARQVIVGVAGTVVGAAVGGRAGAVASTNATLNNFLNHQELSERANKQSACQKGNDEGACKRVRELDALSAQRNEVIRDGMATMTTDQGLQVQQDLATVMVGLYDYKNQLQQELGATSDPSRRAELSNQISGAGNNIRQLAGLGQDNLLSLYSKTNELKYWYAYKQLQASSSGNEIADVLMSGVALLGKDRKPTRTNGAEGGKNLGGEGTGGNPLLADALPRNGDRAVYGQGEGTVTCGHNSCGMVLDTMGKPVDVGDLVKKAPPSQEGITRDDVVKLMRTNGVNAVAVENRNIDDLARLTATGTPVVVRLEDKEMKFSHFVVVDGVTTTSTGQSVVAVRDPLGKGKQYFSPIESFGKYFSGEVVIPRSK